MFNSRIKLRHHCPYSTKNNSFSFVRTPGKRLSIIYKKNKIGNVKCNISNERINGIKRYFLSKVMSLCKRKKKISRIYGGFLSGKSLRERIIKAFLLEEQKIVKKVLKIRKNRNL